MDGDFRLTLHSRLQTIPHDDVDAYKACVKDCFADPAVPVKASHKQLLDIVMQGWRVACPSTPPKAAECEKLIPDLTPAN